MDKKFTSNGKVLLTQKDFSRTTKKESKKQPNIKTLELIKRFAHSFYDIPMNNIKDPIVLLN